MKKNKLEYRMYGLVPYNISPIQQGIQFGHGVVEYSNKYSKDENYKQWSKKDKTFIILNGGTTNWAYDIKKVGTMNVHLGILKHNKIKLAEFSEPDLGDQLTAVVFLVDERVFNKSKYPDDNGVDPFEDWTVGIPSKEKKQILFLREFLSQFRLA